MLLPLAKTETYLIQNLLNNIFLLFVKRPVLPGVFILIKPYVSLKNYVRNTWIYFEKKAFTGR